jgi:GTP-binding protein EngB required for normal cell division
VENTEDSQHSLNSSQKAHLLTSCQYADQLLAEAETILAASSSKSPFNKYNVELSPVQTKVVQDYIGWIRTQMLRVLESQGISPPAPRFGARHTVRVNLEFADIAFDECRPEAMRGYGEVPEFLVTELNGLVSEMSGLVRKLSSYLAQDLGRDLQGRLQRLEQTGAEIELLKTVERVINAHGLVEFRPSLSIILDRLENNSFQIALFGRVNSGKSSLLNRVLETDVLPVGVNPITAVPTRIVHGEAESLVVSYVDKKAERLTIDRLPEFASEEFNAGNSKNVVRIAIELPSAWLREGVVFVDTPGLGSLATAGARETLAYLPQCDLGVVLVDAGSTLTDEDLSTLQALYEAAIPALVLLSKADLLGPPDRERSLKYIASQIDSHLSLKLPVHAVSSRTEHSHLLDAWFNHEILPLCERHQELAQQSLRRKIGALREAVAAALNVRLELASKRPKREKARLRAVETQLRKASGKLEETKAACVKVADEIREFSELAILWAAHAVGESWARREPRAIAVEALVVSKVTHAAADKAKEIPRATEALARDLSRALEDAAGALGVTEPPDAEDLTAVLKEMPRFDPGSLKVVLRPDRLKVFGKKFTTRRVERKLLTQIGPMLGGAFESYGRMLQAWVRRTFGELQRQFDAHADAYRAQLGRLSDEGVVGAEELPAIRRDLEAISPTSNPQQVQVSSSARR